MAKKNAAARANGKAKFLIFIFISPFTGIEVPVLSRIDHHLRQLCSPEFRFHFGEIGCNIRLQNFE
jgi:hypothetical protein